MMAREYETGRSLVASLDFGTEITEGILSLAEMEGVDMAAVSAIGALSRAEIGYYDQTSHQYRTTRIDRPVELVSCTGNLSMRDGSRALHLHAVLGDDRYHLLGGHLQRGEVFAAEVHLLEHMGQPLSRSHDPATDLYLWRDR
ncbi:MAG: DUF296 domain-containing protein [Methanosarcinales archaeon]|nr:DUF296 domain-containing protein [Methanosarcinales archaeon]